MTSFTKMNVKTLKAECKALKLKGYSKMKKSELITFLQQNQPIVEEVREAELVIPEVRETTLKIQLPSNLSTSPMPGSPDRRVPEEDDVLGDLDDFIGNYDEELQKQEEQMKKELLEKLEQIKREEEQKRLEEQKKEEEEENKRIEEQKRKDEITKVLSTFDLEDLIQEAQRRGYVMNKKHKGLNKTQNKLLAHNVDDLDMLSDDEDL